jgi:ribosomal protein S18 acetylase RimI-like enzyme
VALQLRPMENAEFEAWLPLARRRGLTRIALHVGARNDVARNLYRSLGFEENEVAMNKPI